MNVNIQTTHSKIKRKKNHTINLKSKSIFSKITKFPLFIQLDIKRIKDFEGINSILPFSINFYFLPIFNVVTCEVVNNKNLLTTNHYLSNIFLPPANLLSNFKIEIEKSISIFIIKFLGSLCDEFKPNENFYDYIQLMSNNVNYQLNYIKKISEILQNKKFIYNSKEEYYLEDPYLITTDNFLSKLCERIKCLPHLQNQIDYFIKNKNYLNEVMQNYEFKNIKIKEKSYGYLNNFAIKQFERMSQLDYLKIYEKVYNSMDENYKIVSYFEEDEEGKYFKKYIRVPITNYSTEEADYYLISMTKEDEGITANAYIEVGYDYPSVNRYSRTPKFILTLKSDKKNKDESKIPENLRGFLTQNNHEMENENEGYSDVLRALEAILNEQCEKFCPVEYNHLLLSFQIRYLQLSLDHLITNN